MARARKRPSRATPRPVLSRCRIGAGCASACPRRGVMSRRREREAEPVWVSPPAPDLFCSVCSEVFADPVTLACGHTFCRACAVSWFTAPAKLCPAARCPASKNAKPATLATAWTVKGTADALRVYCRFGLREDERGALVPDPEGCPAQLCHRNAAAHEAACEHALEACPFAGCGVQRRRRDADAHDAEVAVAHARGERQARLALETRVATQETRLAALEALVARGGSGDARAGAVAGAVCRAARRYAHASFISSCVRHILGNVQWRPDSKAVAAGERQRQLRVLTPAERSYMSCDLLCLEPVRRHGCF